MPKTYVLSRVQFVPRPLDEVFEFFAEPENLERVTPDFLRFRIVTPRPIAMEVGTLIDYRLQLFRVPFSWRTRIEAYEKNRMFIDRQIKGPYTLWHHLHTFEESADGTWIRDRVDYQIPLGPAGTLAKWVFVGQTLERIFDYRYARIEEILAPGDAVPDSSRRLQSA